MQLGYSHSALAYKRLLEVQKPQLCFNLPSVLFDHVLWQSFLNCILQIAIMGRLCFSTSCGFGRSTGWIVSEERYIRSYTYQYVVSAYCVLGTVPDIRNTVLSRQTVALHTELTI